MTNIKFEVGGNSGKIKKYNSIDRKALNHRYTQSDYAGLVEWND